MNVSFFCSNSLEGFLHLTYTIVAFTFSSKGICDWIRSSFLPCGYPFRFFSIRAICVLHRNGHNDNIITQTS